MLDNKGSILILSIIVGSIMFLLSTFFLYFIYLDKQIVNSSINNTQSYYLAEDKIYICFDEESDYYKKLILRLKHYLKYKYFENSAKKNLIILDQRDLNSEDTKDIMRLEMFKKEGVLNGGLMSESDYKSIDKMVCGIFTVINPFYSMNTSILSKKTGKNFKDKKSIEEFMEDLFSDFRLDDFEEKSEIININDYRKVNIHLNDRKANRIRVDLFRHIYEQEPTDKLYLSKEEMLLISKGQGKQESEINIYADEKRNWDRLKGVIYVDGDLNLYGKVIFNGIIVINSGKLNVYSDDKPEVNGMFILNGYKENEKLIKEKVKLKYDQVVVDRFGVYLPNYVQPELYLIKEGGVIKDEITQFNGR